MFLSDTDIVNDFPIDSGITQFSITKTGKSGKLMIALTRVKTSETRK